MLVKCAVRGLQSGLRDTAARSGPPGMHGGCAPRLFLDVCTGLSECLGRGGQPANKQFLRWQGLQRFKCSSASRGSHMSALEQDGGRAEGGTTTRPPLALLGWKGLDEYASNCTHYALTTHVICENSQDFSRTKNEPLPGPLRGGGAAHREQTSKRSGLPGKFGGRLVERTLVEALLISPFSIR